MNIEERLEELTLKIEEVEHKQYLFLAMVKAVASQPDSLPTEDAITTTALAKQARRCPSTVCGAIKRGTLKAKHFLGHYYIEPEDAQEYIRKCRYYDLARGRE